MTEKRLQEIQELCDKATRGPWEAKKYPIPDCDCFGGPLFNWTIAFKANGGKIICRILNFGEELYGEPYCNAKFIFQSRQIVPELLEEIKRLRVKLSQGRSRKDASLVFPQLRNPKS